MIQTTRPTFAKVGLTIAVLIAAISVTSVASLALFTDQETIESNTFGSGSVDLTASPTTAVLSTPSMAPGDVVTAPVTVTNSGTLDLRYAMSSTTTENIFSGELLLTVKVGVAACDDIGFDLTGTTLYTGILGSIASAPILGSNVSGADPGDRALSAGASEVLCLSVSFPLTATNASQGLSTTATFEFDAEQTRNN